MRLKCAEAMPLYDVVGGYQRYDIYDLEIANGNEKMLFESYTAPDGQSLLELVKSPNSPEDIERDTPRNSRGGGNVARLSATSREVSNQRDH